MSRARWKKSHNGLNLRSGLEKRLAEFLDKKKVSYEYETMVLNYTIPEKVHSYKPDFILHNGVVIEAKGNFDAAARRKMALVIEQNPQMDIRLLFMRDNTISKNSKTKYSDWCDARGIVYHVDAEGKIPDSWYKVRKTRA